MRPPINADLLITDCAILTMDAANTVIESGDIAISGQHIVAVGDGVAESCAAAQTIDGNDHIALPGLVDTHVHTAQQFERSLLKHLNRKQTWREPVWQTMLFPFEASLTEDDVYLSGLFCYANMLKLGTTCFADAGGPMPEMMALAAEKLGIRGAVARSTLDAKDGVPREMTDTVQGVIEKGERLHKHWHGKADGRIRTWMGMRQLMVCSDELMRAIKALADQLNTCIHIHLAEGPYEVDHAIVRSGKRPTEFLESLGFLGPGPSRVHAAHSVMLSERELDLYQQHDVSVGHCPVAMFSYTGVAKAPDMLRRMLRVGLGTDGAAFSGGSLDLFRQMHIAFQTHAAVYGMPYRDPLPVTQEDLLRAATFGGARALRWEDEIGSLEAGKKADLILLSRYDLDVLPGYDPLHTASSNASGAHVRTVIVDGQVVVRDGALLTIDEDELKARVRERAPKIVERFLKRVG
jgi:5-methylthioadenosine/S-adenosylhomocysteine deaminase